MILGWPSLLNKDCFTLTKLCFIGQVFCNADQLLVIKNKNCCIPDTYVKYS